MYKEYLIIFSILANFTLGLIVYLKDRKNIINRSFFLFVISFVVWATTMLFYVHPILINAAGWIKMTYSTTILLIPATLYFFGRFCGVKTEFLRKLILFSIFSHLPFMWILFFTDWWVVNVVLEPWGYHTITGPAYPFYAIYAMSYGVWLAFILFQKYKKSKDLERLQVRYMGLGIILYAVFVSIVDLILPIVSKTSAYFWTSPVYFLFFVVLTALAITKYHLFEIKVVLTELLVGIIAIISFVLPFIIETTLPMKILMVSVFLLFCFIGYLLIKSTHREIKAKEILEERVQERTKELEERTKESERRAEEIQKRKEDLERFYKLTVGRELKMIELKEKIRELEKE